MTCPQCGHKNPATERFCGRCGASLVGGGPRFNKGCFIPIILIASVFVMSVVVLLVIAYLDKHGPKLIAPPPLTRPVLPVLPTARPATVPIGTTLPSHHEDPTPR